MKNWKRLGEAGMGMVETMVAAGIAIVVIMGLVYGLSNSIKGQHSVTQTSEANSLRQAVLISLSSDNMCTQAFPGITFPTGWTTIDVPQFNFGANPLLKKAVNINGVVADAVTLTNQTVGGPLTVSKKTSVDPAPPVYKTMNLFYAKLTISLSKANNADGASVGGNGMKDRDFYLAITADPSAGNALFSCAGGTDLGLQKTTCEETFGGTYDSTKTPSCELDRSAIGMRPDLTNAHTGSLIVHSTNYQAAIAIAGDDSMASGSSYSSLYLTKFPHATPTAPGQSWTVDFNTGTQGLEINEQAPSGAMGTPAIEVAHSSHFVGINNTTPSYQFDVTGTSHFNGTSQFDGGAATFTTMAQFPAGANGSTFTTSDRRLKTSITPLEIDDIAMKALEPYRFVMKDDLEKKPRFGFLAQEVQKYFPEAVVQMANGYLAVEYPMLLAPIMVFLKNLKLAILQTNSQVAELNKRVEGLEKQNSILIQRLELLERKK